MDNSLKLRRHAENIAYYAEQFSKGSMEFKNAYYAIEHVMGILSEEMRKRNRIKGHELMD